MKPDFALILSFDGIRLVHRGVSGWDDLGDVPLDTPALAANLAQLREQALAVASGGVHTKLVLPNEQIRFLRFEAEGRNTDAIGEAVRHHLRGATPYDLEDLAHDWSVSAGQVFVAAVARETLVEAEAFALKHGFEPLCFVAMPEGREFVGEPWFGQTNHAASVLEDGAHLERDTVAIRLSGVISDVLSNGAYPAAEGSDEPGVAPDAAKADEPQTPSFRSIRPDPTPENTTADTPAKAEPETLEEDVSSSDVDDPLAFTTRRPVRTKEPATDISNPDPEPDTDADADADDPAEAEIAPVTPEVPDETALPDVAASQNAPAKAPAFDPPTGPARTPEMSEAETPFITKRLTPEPARKTPPAPLVADPKPQRMKAAGIEDEKRQMTLFGARGPEKNHGAPRYLGVALAAGIACVVAGLGAWALMFQGEDTASRETAIPRTLFDVEDTVLAPSLSQQNAVPQDIASVPSGEPAPDATREPTAPVAPEPSGQTQAALPEVDAAPSVPSADVPVPGEDATARVEAADIWQNAPETPNPPASQSLDNFYRTSIDPRVEANDAVALPLSTAYSPDPQPAPLANPAPPGTRFDFDARGFVRATPDGAVTPNGVSVFAGRPALVAPPRPAETLQQDLPATSDDDVPEITDVERARLAEVRPRSRPDDLSEQNERAALGSGGRTQAELAARRPNLRPPSAQELAEQANAAATANLDTEDDADGPPFAGATQQAVATSFVPRARPDKFETIVARAEQAAEQRARDSAERELARQTPQPVQEQTRAPQSASLAQPVLEPEDTRRTAAAAVPRSQRVTPNARTAASVARAATEENVLSLRRINLIGVYGGPSDRRALVRLANGRYKKVKVGDRLDGGRVTAIGTSELRYSKGGRAVALKMPQG